jgi:hypothetical protein
MYDLLCAVFNGKELVLRETYPSWWYGLLVTPMPVPAVNRILT